MQRRFAYRLGANRRVPRLAPSKLAMRVGWLWLLQCMLVVLLVADQVASPLHPHHHDSAIDGHWLSAAHAEAAALAAHADDADAERHFSHSILALRPQLKAFDHAGDAEHPVLIAGLLASTSVPSVADPRLLERPDKVPPPYTSHRSLPPAGRAPPLHA